MVLKEFCEAHQWRKGSPFYEAVREELWGRGSWANPNSEEGTRDQGGKAGPGKGSGGAGLGGAWAAERSLSFSSWEAPEELSEDTMICFMF